MEQSNDYTIYERASTAAEYAWNIGAPIQFVYCVHQISMLCHALLLRRENVRLIHSLPRQYSWYDYERISAASVELHKKLIDKDMHIMKKSLENLGIYLIDDFELIPLISPGTNKPLYHYDEDLLHLGFLDLARSVWKPAVTTMVTDASRFAAFIKWGGILARVAYQHASMLFRKWISLSEVEEGKVRDSHRAFARLAQRQAGFWAWQVSDLSHLSLVKGFAVLKRDADTCKSYWADLQFREDKLKTRKRQPGGNTCLVQHHIWETGLLALTKRCDARECVSEMTYAIKNKPASLGHFIVLLALNVHRTFQDMRGAAQLVRAAAMACEAEDRFYRIKLYRFSPGRVWLRIDSAAKQVILFDPTLISREIVAERECEGLFSQCCRCLKKKVPQRIVLLSGEVLQFGEHGPAADLEKAMNEAHADQFDRAVLSFCGACSTSCLEQMVLQTRLFIPPRGL